MSNIVAIIVENTPALVLAGVLVFREWQNWRDRRDLLDRIMSADFKDYKRFTRIPGKPEFPNRMTDEEMARAEAGIKHS